MNRRNFLQRIGLALAACVVPITILPEQAPKAVPDLGKPLASTKLWLYSWFLQPTIGYEEDTHAEWLEFKLSLAGTASQLDELRGRGLSVETLDALIKANPLLVYHMDLLQAHEWRMSGYTVEALKTDPSVAEPLYTMNVSLVGKRNSI